MAEPLRCVPSDSVITGWDFSTGAVKCLAFDLDGRPLAEVRLPTDLWTERRRLRAEPDAAGRPGPGQRAGHRRPAARAGPAAALGRRRHLGHAPHRRPHRRRPRPGPPGHLLERPYAWPPTTPAAWNASAARSASAQLIGGPWAVRYTLSHLVKDEATPAARRLAAHPAHPVRTGRWRPAT